ncbi:MAG: spore gernimation protein GerPD [Bacillales bacterium]|jgi:spore germination protein PD|nr:spore gernimation protein GerPD [Bacillales bacterium]
MNFSVINRELKVLNIDLGTVTSSSVFLVGDTNYILLNAYFDTPPESLILTPFVPISLR